jgi:hypothetical protein
MPVIPYQISTVLGTGTEAGRKVVWGPMANGDTGQPVFFSDFADYSLQIEGVQGAGFSIAMEGSNDGVNFRTLTDPQGVPISLTSGAIIKQVTEASIQQRPHITGGDGTTSITVTAFYRWPPGRMVQTGGLPI